MESFPGSRTLLVLALALLAARLSLQAQAATAAAAAAAPLAQGLAALQTHQPAAALATLQQALQTDPANATANLLAATAALELYRGPLAVQYAEKARQLAPQEWKIHTTLVAAYSAAGMKAQRDEERALLRQMHATGAADARAASGFLLEMFPVPPPAGSGGRGPWRVDAVEEFAPMGRFRTYYRFLVRVADGARIGEIDVESDDFDERSWAQAHPAEAAAGERQFQIVGHGENHQPIDYRMFSGKPDYDAIRPLVVAALQSRALPARSAH